MAPTVQAKWILLKKDANFRHFKNSFSIYHLIISCFFPFIIILDILMHRLWRQFIIGIFLLLCSLLISILLSVPLGIEEIYAASPFIIYCCGYWIYHHQNRVKNYFAKLEKDGWEQIGFSNEASLKKAIFEWEKQGLIARVK